MPRSKEDIVVCLLLFFLSLFIFTRGLSIHGLEYRDDEIFYYKSTQEMIHSGNIMSPTYFGENRFQKPILYYWLVMSSYKIFGINWFGARWVAVVFAGMTVCVTWLIGKVLFDRKVATLGAVILMTVPLFFRHAKNAVPDMPLNFFIVWAMYCAVQWIRISAGGPDGSLQKNPKLARYNVLFFIACALGFMIKGFAALIVPIITVLLYSLFTKRTKILKSMRFGRGTLIMLLIMCPWFFYMIKMHGQEYLNYMLVDETKNRLINTGGGNIFVKLAATFFDHCLFYLNVIGSYFAPWCIFLIGALPLAFVKMRSAGEEREGLRLMVIWFFVVFFFFSTMYFAINHYMLVLTTPFALLSSYFLLQPINNKLLFGKMANFLRKYMLVFIFTFSNLAFIFLFVFLTGAAKAWLIILIAAYVAMIVGMVRSNKLVTAPLILGIFMLFVFAQSSLLEKAGVTAHAALQKFAATINEDIQSNTGDAVIGVGSHDIHEKEFQVYFEQKVIKAAGSEAHETRAELAGLFQTDKKVYCLITESDFNDYLRKSQLGPLDIIQEDYIFRRRMNIDRGFFEALMKLDQETVHHYLKEKLILVRRGPGV